MTAYERTKAWRLANPERHRAQRARQMAVWRKRHGKVSVVHAETCVECGEPAGRGRNAKRCWPCLRRHRKLAEKFGIGLGDFRAMKTAQGGLCAICRRPPNGHGDFHVDHCHKTGKVRGLLCLSCNAGIGSLGDDVGRLEAAVAYLKAASTPGPSS